MKDTIKLFFHGFFEEHLATKNRSLRFKIVVSLLLTSVAFFLTFQLIQLFFTRH
jgi:hypothetical protein